MKKTVLGLIMPLAVLIGTSELHAFMILHRYECLPQTIDPRKREEKTRRIGEFSRPPLSPTLYPLPINE